MPTPLYSFLTDFAKKNKTRFCMPSHKGKGIGSFLDDVFPYDITELPDSDNLYISNDVIGKAENLAAKAFFSKATCFCTTGASSCVKAMLALGSVKSKNIIADRFCHSSVIDAFALLDLKPKFLYNDYVDNFNIPIPPTKEQVERAIKSTKNPSCVFVTSPNYYGLMADIKGISEVCKKHNILLLVDNSHGTHLAFIDNGKEHPNSQGADIVCDSAHKTLPVLTGGAFLHINCDITRQLSLLKLQMFSSTSPSYLIMASLDYAREYCEKNGQELYKRLFENIEYLKKELSHLGYVYLDTKNCDNTRLTICTANLGINGHKAYEYLYSQNIACEMADQRNIVLIFSLLDKQSDLEKLILGLKSLKTISKKENIINKSFSLIKPKRAMSIRKALFSNSERTNINSSKGRIIAQNIIVYPPSVPIIIAGEIIDDNVIEILKRENISEVFVTI